MGQVDKETRGTGETPQGQTECSVKTRTGVCAPVTCVPRMVVGGRAHLTVRGQRNSVRESGETDTSSLGRALVMCAVGWALLCLPQGHSEMTSKELCSIGGLAQKPGQDLPYLSCSLQLNRSDGKVCLILISMQDTGDYIFRGKCQPLPKIGL